jgi:SAM-dependent methyltransferase
VLDLGAGNGILSFALAECGYRVWALEPGAGSVTGREAMRTLQNATGAKFEILDGWGEDIPLDNAGVDIVVARQVLHHAGNLQNLQKMCSEAYRVLKPQGLFLALREHVVFKGGDLEIFLSSHPMHRLTGEENAYTLPSYKQCIEKAGFSKLKVYAFWDTALNYAPLSTGELDSLFAEKLSKRIPFLTPPFFAKYILKIPGVNYLLRQLLNIAIKTPGSLYTFQAIK